MLRCVILLFFMIDAKYYFFMLRYANNKTYKMQYLKMYNCKINIYPDFAKLLQYVMTTFDNIISGFVQVCIILRGHTLTNGMPKTYSNSDPCIDPICSQNIKMMFYEKDLKKIISCFPLTTMQVNCKPLNLLLQGLLE